MDSVLVHTILGHFCGEQELKIPLITPRNSKGFSELPKIQLILPYKRSCIRVISSEIPILSLIDYSQVAASMGVMCLTTSLIYLADFFYLLCQRNKFLSE